MNDGTYFDLVRIDFNMCMHAVKLHVPIYSVQGLGKRQVEGRRNQHRSENHISWIIPRAPDNSVHRDDTTVLSACSTYTVDKKLLDKFAVGKPNFRRFPHHHVSNNTSHTRPEWLDNSPAVTPLWVLAATQQPYLKRSTWMYTYKQ